MQLNKLARYALNMLPEAHYHATALPGIAPWLYRYYEESAPDRLETIVVAQRALIERCLIEHEALMGPAEVLGQLRKTGWIKVYRSEETLAEAVTEAEKLREFELKIDILDEDGLARLEPHLVGAVGAVHYLDTASVDEPSRVVQGYADLFVKRGGRFLQGDARSLQEGEDGLWSLSTHDGVVHARDLLVSLGPWSDLVYTEFGYDFPLAVKRGYHMHYALRDGATLISSGARLGCGLCARADDARRAAHDGRRIRAPRRGADARAARTDRARRAQAAAARRAPRPEALDGMPPLPAGHAADRGPGAQS